VSSHRPDPAPQHPRQSLLLAIAWGAACLGAAACGGDAEVADPDASLPRARNHNLGSGGLSIQEYDLDRNGQPDQWYYTADDTGQIVRVERDIDFDGRVDLYEHWQGGELVEEEMNLDFDGQVDVVRFYRGAELTRRELSTSFDGLFTMAKFYDAQGQVLRVERDSDRDGRVDTWEYFENGQVIQVGRDADGDGSPEIMDTP
jgi:YD repeat-containing protein